MRYDSSIKESMTASEAKTLMQLSTRLKAEGFKTYGEYLEDNFHINFITSEQAGEPFVAAISVNLGIIFINPALSEQCATLILLHEIGHQVMKHNQHLLSKLKELGINTPSALAYKLENYAGDYHISNRLYDDLFKELAKNIRIKNPDGSWYSFPGLVTEMDFPDHPEYWTMDFDELFDVLVKDYDLSELNGEIAAKNSPPPPPSEPHKLSQDFVDGWNEVMSAYRNGDITDEMLKDYMARKVMWNGDDSNIEHPDYNTQGKGD